MEVTNTIHYLYLLATKENNYFDELLKNPRHCNGCPYFEMMNRCDLYNLTVNKTERLKECRLDSFKNQAEIMADKTIKHFKELSK